jgi:myo-inositol-1(or 4)-monophosphatase
LSNHDSQVEFPDYLHVCERAARAAGEVLLDWRGRFTVREKGPKDIVTDADEAAQAVIREIVLASHPDYGFLGEEDSPEQVSTSENRDIEPKKYLFRWVVDPLDGTVNYVHDLPSYGVSVALETCGDILAGVVFDPVLNECYSAAVGCGAYMNGREIRTSGCTVDREALVAGSLPANPARDCVEIRRFVEVLHAVQAVRRLGSAALNLCYVASGRLDGYFGSTVKPWDVAAGVLIVREAGGVVTSLDGGEFRLEYPDLTCAATPTLHAAVVEALARAQ